MYRMLMVGWLLLQIACAQTEQAGELRFREIRKPYVAESPKIKELRSLPAIERQRAVEKWVARGLPLVEEDPRDDDMLFVTLATKDPREEIQIGFEVFGLYGDPSLGERSLERLPGTDLWHRTYKMPNDICFSYRFVITDGSHKPRKIPDQFNKNTIPLGRVEPYSYSVLDLQKTPTPSAQWNKRQAQVDKGELVEFELESQTLGNTHGITVYLPPGYDSTRKKAYPALFLFDRFIYLNRVQTPVILDNLLAQGLIEPMLAVLVGNPRQARDIELAMNPRFKDFIIEKLLPKIENEYHLSKNPMDRLVGGISYGGLTATYIAFFHPDLFGKVLSESGSFWRPKDFDPSDPFKRRADWLIGQIQQAKRKKLTMFLDWGLQERWCKAAGRRLVRVLAKKGYPHKFVEFNGWHDWSNSRKTFVEGLLYLMGN